MYMHIIAYTYTGKRTILGVVSNLFFDICSLTDMELFR